MHVTTRDIENNVISVALATNSPQTSIISKVRAMVLTQTIAGISTRASQRDARIVASYLNVCGRLRKVKGRNRGGRVEGDANRVLMGRSFR
jgi:hypothetical protein